LTGSNGSNFPEDAQIVPLETETNALVPPTTTRPADRHEDATQVAGSLAVA